MSNTDEALELLKHLADFAYEQGFHECGYNPVDLLRSEIAQLRNDVALRDRCIAWCLEHGVYNWDKKVAPLCVHGGNFESDPIEAPAEFAAIIGGAK